MLTVTIESESELVQWTTSLVEDNPVLTGIPNRDSTGGLADGGVRWSLRFVREAIAIFSRLLFMGGGQTKNRTHNSGRPRPRTWNEPLPNILVVGSQDFGAMVLRVLDGVIGTSNDDGWDLAAREWTSSPRDLNYLVSVLGEPTQGWPFSLKNIQSLPPEEASLLVRAAEGDQLPWYEKDGTFGQIMFGQPPTVIFATTTDDQAIQPGLLEVFNVMLTEGVS